MGALAFAKVAGHENKHRHVEHIDVILDCLDDAEPILQLKQNMPKDNQQHQNALDIIPIRASLFFCINPHDAVRPRSHNVPI